jgi:hypothetical protein
MSNDMPIDNTDHVQVSLALERACSELQALSSSLGRLQTTIPDGISAISPSLCRELQSLDHVHQHLDELCSYLLAVSSLANPEWTIDIGHATADIRLALMIERLRGLHATMGGAHDDAGELELLVESATA